MTYIIEDFGFFTERGVFRVFVSVFCDFSNEDHRRSISELLVQYGFSKVMPYLFESRTITELYLGRLKKDIDRLTDSYDIIRIYQYPLEGILVISFLKEKKWKKMKILTNQER